MAELAVGSPVVRLARHPHSALLAVACDDLTIRMFDIEVRRPVANCDASTSAGTSALAVRTWQLKSR